MSTLCPEKQYKYMLKVIKTILIFALTASVSGQSFVSTENVTVRKNITLTYNVKQDDSIINEPVIFWFDYNPVNSIVHVTATLSHGSSEFTLNTQLVNSNTISAPITNFNNTTIKGLWKLKLNTDSTFVLNNWGIDTIPEPTSLSLLFFAGISIIIFYRLKKYIKNEKI